MTYVALKIGTLGRYTKDAVQGVTLLLLFTLKTVILATLDCLDKTVISCSKFMYQVHKSTCWNSSIHVVALYNY